MLDPNEIRMIILDFLKNFEEQEFRNYIDEIEDYEMIENFCEGISIRIIEYKTNKRKNRINGDKNNI